MPGLFTKGSVERVKDAVDMVELVGVRTDLRRVGSRHVGLCPFHEERTPSFSVNAEHKLYHCFGCGESGDAISFVRATEALDFPAAVEFLADRYGIELEREEEDPRAEERRRRRERLEGLLERTAAFYERFLWESAEGAHAREYLLGRGLSEEVLREFRVGYAPSAWNRVLDAGQRDGHTIAEMVAAGVVMAGRQGGHYDRFRARIMFPLADARGRVLGFGARALRPAQKPKYLNSSENELYRKGRHLFGIDRARAPAARAGRIVVVEGYTDVLALHQAGIRESVAIMGTALTPEQFRELSRAAGSVFLALDADRSGQEAMLRAARMAGERGTELRVVDLPEGRDPAELVAEEGAEAIERRLAQALSVPEFETRRVLAGADLTTPRGRDRALEQVRPLIAATPARSATRDELVRQVADRLDLPPDYLTIQAAAPPTPADDSTRAASGGRRPEGRSVSSPAAAADRAFLAMCVGQPELGRELLERAEGYLTTPELERTREHLLAHLDDPLADLPEDPGLSSLVTAIAMRGQEEPASEPVIRLTFLQLELRRVERDLRHAAQEGDLERQRALWGPLQEVRRGIDELMSETV